MGPQGDGVKVPAPEIFFIFAHGSMQYGLPVVQVLEIVEMPVLLSTHGTMQGCLGNVSYRGHLLPVLDPTALSSGPTAIPSKTFVVVRHDGVVFGLATDSFVSFVALDAIPDAAAEAPGEGGRFVQKARAYLGNALTLLCVGAIVRLVRQHFSSQSFLADDAELQRRDPVAGYGEEILLCVCVEKVLFGIPVEHVIEIVEGYDVTPLFGVPPIIRGLINLRGQVVACLDISTELGLPPRLLSERNQFVVLKQNSAELALCVDKVIGIRRLSPDKVQKAEAALTGDINRFASGMHEVEDGTLFVLAVNAVFDAPPLQLYRDVAA